MFIYIVLFGFSLMELSWWPPQHQNLQDWKYREAAVLAYGSIMEGPTSEKMRPMVEQSLSHLVMALQDPSVAVRDSDGNWICFWKTFENYCNTRVFWGPTF